MDKVEEFGPIGAFPYVGLRQTKGWVEAVRDVKAVTGVALGLYEGLGRFVNDETRPRIGGWEGLEDLGVEPVEPVQRYGHGDRFDIIASCALMRRGEGLLWIGCLNY